MPRWEVVLYAKDKYNRYLAKVYADNQNVAEVLLKKDLAKPYYGKGKKPDWCE